MKYLWFKTLGWKDIESKKSDFAVKRLNSFSDSETQKLKTTESFTLLKVSRVLL